MNISEFGAIIRKANCEIVYEDRVSVRVGEYAHFFYSFYQLDGDLFSLNVKYPVLPLYEIGQENFHDDRIYLNRHSQSSLGYEIIEKIDLGRGGDPRVVADGKNAYAIFIGNPLSDDQALLYDIRKQRLLPILHTDPKFFYGKNWQPFLDRGELFVVHELNPFRVIRIDTDSGIAGTVRELDTTLKLSCFHTSYPMFRGGSNAVMVENQLFGVGRATSQRFRHHPFFWAMDSKNHFELAFTEFFSPFYQAGFNIIDPTSFYFDRENLFLGLCCTERDWVHSQNITNFLLVFRPTDNIDSSRSLVRYFESKQKCEVYGKPNLDKHLFFCVEMPNAIANIVEHGGRLSTGESGHLVFGPYVEIVTEGLYCAELSYFTLSCELEFAGEFDISVCKLNESEDIVDYRIIGRTEISSRPGEMSTIAIAFDTSGYIGWKLETRVFVEHGVKLNAFHIRTWRNNVAENNH